MNHRDAVSAIQRSALAAQESLLTPHLAPMIRLYPRRGALAHPLASRFAGLAMLPRGVAWPTWDASAYHRSWIAYHEKKCANLPASFTPERRAQFLERAQKSIADEEASILRNPRPLHFLAMLRCSEFAEHAHHFGLPNDGAHRMRRQSLCEPLACSVRRCFLRDGPCA